VGLIVASVGVRDGLVSAKEFSAIVVMVLVTTLITPPILRGLFTQKKDKAKEMYRNVITTYVGDAYRSYVKQAEFGLEDLKEK